VAEPFDLKTEMAEGESAAVIGPTRLPASRVASSYRCNRCEPASLVEPSTTPSSSLSIPVSRLNLKTEMAEGESAVVIGPTRLPASRVASSYRCNRCEPESLVEPSTTSSSSLSIPVSRLNAFMSGPRCEAK
jgi:cytochrome c-type biogenesis protein CcmH/NrfF